MGQGFGRLVAQPNLKKKVPSYSSGWLCLVSGLGEPEYWAPPNTSSMLNLEGDTDKPSPALGQFSGQTDKYSCTDCHAGKTK